MQIVELQEVEQKTESIQAQIAQKRQELKANQMYVQQYLDDVLKSPNTINIMLKTADRGTEETLLTQIESLKESLQNQYGMDINLLSSDVGDVTPSDMEQAGLFSATIMCFNAKISPDILKTVKSSCSIKSHKLIHTFLDDIKSLCVERQKQIDGQSGINQKCQSLIADIFKVNINKRESKLAAGVKVTEGRLCKRFKVKIYRNNKPISGFLHIQSMKHFKKDVIELKKGEQCTLIFDQEVQFAKGDIIKVFE